MSQYKIAGLVMNVTSDKSVYTKRLCRFLFEKQRATDVNITLTSNNFIRVPDGNIILDENIVWLKKPSGQKGYFLYAPLNNHSVIPALADIDDKWKNGLISYCDEREYPEQNINDLTEVYSHLLMGLMGVVFRYSLIQRQGIVIHSSAIAWDGKGIIFSAPAGTGKSTQVRLWQKYLGDGVTVLNDDTPAVCLKNGKPYVFGTPWCGSSFIHCNACAPLKAIVMLEQAMENSISKLSKQEVILRLLPRVLLPYVDQSLMSKAVDIFELIISKVPVYLLKGKPDEEAVEMVWRVVK